MTVLTKRATAAVTPSSSDDDPKGICLERTFVSGNNVGTNMAFGYLGRRRD